MKVIIHHANCPDGFGAAWWLGRHLGEHVKIAANWGEPPDLEAIDGNEVWIVDFCYPPDDLLRIIEACGTLDVLDHHATSAEWMAALKEVDRRDIAILDNVHHYCDLRELCGGEKANIVIDQTHSGAGLVAALVRRWLAVDPPAFLRNVEDRDLWRYELHDTADVFAAVTSRPYTDEAWDQMFDMEAAYESFSDGGHSLGAEGEAINRYRRQLIEQVSASTFTIAIGNYAIPCASAPYAIGSDVAGELVKRNPELIGAYVILHADHVQIGLRSAEGGPDVAALAEPYGGGGHVHASGLRMGWSQFLWARDTAMVRAAMNTA